METLLIIVISLGLSIPCIGLSGAFVWWMSRWDETRPVSCMFGHSFIKSSIHTYAMTEGRTGMIAKCSRCHRTVGRHWTERGEERDSRVRGV